MIDDLTGAFLTAIAAASVALLAVAIIGLAHGIVRLVRVHPVRATKELLSAARHWLTSLRIPQPARPLNRALEHGFRWREASGVLVSLGALLVVLGAVESLVATTSTNGSGVLPTVSALPQGIQDPRELPDRLIAEASPAFSPVPSAVATQPPIASAQPESPAPTQPEVAPTPTSPPPEATPTPGPTQEQTPTPAPRPTPAPTPSPTPAPTPSPTPAPTPSPTPTPAPTPTPPPDDEAPEIDSFTASPRQGDRPLHVVFEATWTGADEWELQFGDDNDTSGTGRSLRRPHTYPHTGTYVATLRIIGPGGSASARVEIVVSD